MRKGAAGPVFVVSKLFWWLFDPANLLLLALACGVAILWSPWHMLGRWILSAAAAFAVLITLFPVGEWLAAPLERRFPVKTVQAIPAEIKGILVLGGGIIPSLSTAHGQPALNSHAERLTRAVVLARKYPDLPIFFTGGSAALFGSDQRESSGARRFFEDIGLSPGRVRYESESRNTRENAVNTYRLVRPGPGETWLLVTSALHMPRAIGAFRKAGWRVSAYPVDFTTGATRGFDPRFRFANSLDILSKASHEWVGLAAYRVLGWSNALFPGPDTEKRGRQSR